MNRFPQSDSDKHAPRAHVHPPHSEKADENSNMSGTNRMRSGTYPPPEIAHKLRHCRTNPRISTKQGVEPAISLRNPPQNASPDSRLAMFLIHSQSRTRWLDLALSGKRYFRVSGNPHTHMRPGVSPRLAALVLTPALCMAQGYITNITAGPGGLGQPTAEPHLDISGPGVLAADAAGNLFLTVRDGVFRIDRAGVRTRIAGIGKAWQYRGDGGPATLAPMNPRAVAIDAAGNLYLADTGNHRIRRLDAATGIVTTVAGTGVRGFSGDRGPAAGAQLDGPTGVALDAAGNLYIADGAIDGHDRIRRVDPATGSIDTVAGNGSQGYSGDGGPATRAQFHTLGGLAVDRAGNVYIADNFNNRVRMVSGSTGIVNTVAGNGLAGGAGDGELATGAELNNPLSMALDAQGNLYIADAGNFRIRKVSAATGRIATVAGSGSAVIRTPSMGTPARWRSMRRGTSMWPTSALRGFAKCRRKSRRGMRPPMK